MNTPEGFTVASRTEIVGRCLGHGDAVVRDFYVLFRDGRPIVDADGRQMQYATEDEAAASAEVVARGWPWMAGQT